MPIAVSQVSETAMVWGFGAIVNQYQWVWMDWGPITILVLWVGIGLALNHLGDGIF